MMDELKEQTNVKDEQLDTVITDVELQDLAAYFEDTDSYVGWFDLLTAEISDVKSTTNKSGTQAGMTLLLQSWKNRNPSKATLRALLLILLSMNPVKGALALDICNHLLQKREFVAVQSGCVGMSQNLHKQPIQISSIKGHLPFRYFIKKVHKRLCCLAGQATTINCFMAHQK